jgi:hypothetical protein
METLQRTANRGSISTGYDIDNSLKFERANSEQIFTSNAASGNRKTWTFSAWIKRTELSQDYHTIFSCGYSNIQIMSNDRPRLILYNGSSEVYADPEMLMRDTAAWYHIVVQVDSTQSTASDRVKWYINGDRITNFNNSTYTNMSQNEDFDFGQAGSGSDNYLRLGEFFGGSEGFSGYMADVYYLNGTAAQASDFGEYDSDSGIWIPKEYTGSGYGTQGFKYEFKDSSALGTDTSGEGHDANNLSNITAADQATDTPTNNFCTPLLIQPFSSTDTITHTEGGTKLTTGSGTGWRTNMASVSLSSGKWYFEAKHPGTIDGDAIMTSIVPTARFGNSGYASFYGGQSSGDGIGWYWDSTRFRYDDGSAISPPTNTVNSGDILGIALDMDNNFVYSRINGGAWHNNGSADGDPTSGSSGTGGFAVADEPHMICTSMYQPLRNFFVNYGGYNAFPVSSAASDANGYGVFEYAPPSGYYAICTKNLAEYG